MSSSKLMKQRHKKSCEELVLRRSKNPVHAVNYNLLTFCLFGSFSLILVIMLFWCEH